MNIFGYDEIFFLLVMFKIKKEKWSGVWKKSDLFDEDEKKEL